MWGQIIIALVCASEILAHDCVIPSSSQFSRASYRRYHGRTASGKTIYDAGERLIVGTWIRVVCNKDRQGDAVLKVSNHLCSAGNWSPALPVCQEYARCGAPHRVENATASERITPYITFPHQTVVHYKCNAGFDKRGTIAYVKCVDGEWTSADVICVDRTTITSEKKENTEITTQNNVRIPITTARTIPLCIEPDISHGKLVKNVTSGYYDVICDVGFKVISPKSIRCLRGVWSEPIPQCDILRCPQLSANFTLYQSRRYSTRTGSGYAQPVGRALNSGLPHGAAVKINCGDDAYPTLGVERAWCHEGRWLPREPICKKYCARPASVNLNDANTQLLPVPKLVMDGVSVTQTCADGNTRMNYCADGSWLHGFLPCL
ncbi:complement factor H-like [Dreissena polymorpha]|uniref:complement factor H-like n=1 Tax=Dreissena polymorpha TaxID=45954 RepID=UPI002263B994|nr:complement factor H-like [Dreissena polymorpha]